MCFLLLSLDPNSHYPLVIAANRDEFHDRPARPAKFWSQHPNIIAGRDEQAGGSWLGMNKRGQFACLTNFRDGRTPTADAPSRGDLVIDYLADGSSNRQFSQTLLERRTHFNGFNLVFGSLNGLSHISNRNRRGELRLRSGVHGLSNGDLNDNWPKVVRGRKAFESIIKAPDSKAPDTDQLLALLADTQIADDGTLPETGVGIERERTLSPIFIRSGSYGTRCSTVITVCRNGTVNFIERSFNMEAEVIGDIHESFEIQNNSIEQITSNE